MQYEDDITAILNVYCRHLSRDKPGMEIKIFYNFYFSHSIDIQNYCIFCPLSYCNCFVTDIFVVTRSPHEGSEVLSRLMEALFQMMAVLATLEPAPTSPAASRHSSQCDSLLQRTDC